MQVINTNQKQHAVYKSGFLYKIPCGEVMEVPDRVGLAMMRRFPFVEEWKGDVYQSKIARANTPEKKLDKKKKRMAKKKVSKPRIMPVIELAADK